VHIVRWLYGVALVFAACADETLAPAPLPGSSVSAPCARGAPDRPVSVTRVEVPIDARVDRICLPK
jgi:hypothetical protein